MKRMILLLLIALTALVPCKAGAAGIEPTGTKAGETVLEIVCSGLENGDRALYDVYGPDGTRMYSVALTGSGKGNAVSRYIKGLSPGLYKVRPTGWDWTYQESPVAVEHTLRAGETVTFDFSATKRTNVRKHYEEGKLNRFKPNPSASASTP